jgi:hypothetical protein
MRVVPLLAFVALTGSTFAAPETKPTLLQLAEAKFKSPPLSAAEKELFIKTEIGQGASALTNDEGKDNPAQAKDWGPERVVRAECLEWLCTNPEAVKHVTFRGITIQGMRVEGKLDLDFAQLPFGLFTWGCAFTHEISMRSAHFVILSLQFTHLKKLAIDAAKIEADVFLLNNCVLEGSLELIDTSIGGTLDCSDAEIHNPEGLAINANRAKIGASTFLRGDFKADGQVNLRLATIGGNLVCTKGQFIGSQQAGDPTRTALSADGAKVAGNVFFNGDFKAQGEVNLLGATVGGTLYFDKAELSNPDGSALDASDAEINRGIYFRNHFKSEGSVNLVGTMIRGDLECDQSEFSNPRGTALSADEIKVGRSVFLRNGFKPDGGASFSGAQITGYFNWLNVTLTPNSWLNLESAKMANLVDDEASWPSQGNLFLDGFTYDRMAGASPVSTDARLRWIRRQPTDKFVPQPYEQLALVMKSMGHEREARRIMIEKNRDHARYLSAHGGAGLFLSHEWWWYNVFGRLIGYGYAPSRAFFISLAWILIGYYLFEKGYRSPQQLILPTNDRAYVKEGGQIVIINNRPKFSDEYPSFNAFVCSLETFTPLLKLDQSSNWAPNARRGKSFRIWRWQLTTGSLLRAYLWVHIIAGWIFTSLWVGAVTGLVKS